MPGKRSFPLALEPIEFSHLDACRSMTRQAREDKRKKRNETSGKSALLGRVEAAPNFRQL